MPIADFFFQNPASKTLLIPLFIRSLESRRLNGLFRDKAAQDIVARLPDDIFTFSMHPFMRIGTAVRIRYLDDLTKDFLARADQPVIVELGCGLGTRFSRVDNGKGVYINIDLPEVVTVRQNIFPHSNERDIDWRGDLLERDWMNRLKKEYAGHQFMFIAEGVLMYLAEGDVRKLITDIADQFPGAHIAFDTSGSLSTHAINKKSAVRQLKASLVWAYDDDGSLDLWHPRLRRLERAYYFNRHILRWGLWSLIHFTPIGKSSAMFHFEVETGGNKPQ